MDAETQRHIDLYRKLLLIRRAEEKIQENYGEDEMKTPVHLAIGQETVTVGVCDALGNEDQVVGSYRSHTIYLARTDDPEGMFAELYGRVTGPGRGRAGSMHLSKPSRGVLLTSAVAGTPIPVAVGLAYSNHLGGSHRAVAVFFGDRALDEGVFWESFDFACLKRLPVLLVCEDNGLAIHSRDVDRHGSRSIIRIVENFDCHAVQSETTDTAELSPDVWA